MKIKRKKQITNAVLIVMAFVAISLFFWSQHEIPKDIKHVETVNFDAAAWNTIKSEDINAHGIGLMSGESPLGARLYMDGDMQLLIRWEDVTECFQCAADLYDGNMLKLQKKDTVIQFPVQEACYFVNDVRVEDGRFVTEREDGLYLPVLVLAEQFQCDYEWDAESYTARLTDRWADSITPSRYNLQEQGRDTIIKNQGTLGTCWAVAALSALESSLKPEEEYLFATDHMSIRNSFYMSQNAGGEYTMAMAYLLSWQGPVLESDDPYGDHISPVGLTAVKHVQEIQVYKEKDVEKIKRAVFFYGAVQSSIYTSLRGENSRSTYYNRSEAAYCYIGEETPNHEIIIIGWDDDYPAENFNVEVEGNGAFICQNSWGTGFGHDGIFYISYYDSYIGTQSIVYTGVENRDNYDNIYQTDLCGWAGQLGYNSDTAYFANAFTANSDEVVRAAGFYATGMNTSYEIYFVTDFEDVNSFQKRVMVASGQLAEAGFYTIPFESEQNVGENQKFAVVIKITTPDSIHPVAVEYAADEATQNVVLDDGEGYISVYGVDWSSVEAEQNCNVCMKVYTNDQ